jgi:hypothetical protein
MNDLQAVFFFAIQGRMVGQTKGSSRFSVGASSAKMAVALLTVSELPGE